MSYFCFDHIDAALDGINRRIIHLSAMYLRFYRMYNHTWRYS